MGWSDGIGKSALCEICNGWVDMIVPFVEMKNRRINLSAEKTHSGTPVGLCVVGLFIYCVGLPHRSQCPVFRRIDMCDALCSNLLENLRCWLCPTLRRFQHRYCLARVRVQPVDCGYRQRSRRSEHSTHHSTLSRARGNFFVG